MHRFAAAAVPASAVLPIAARVRADTSTVLGQVDPLLWTMIAISTAGAIVTFAVLAYALAKFRDPAVRRRRYG